jgi:hypothetical protein
MGIGEVIESYKTNVPIRVDPKLLGYEKCVYVGCAALSTCYVTEGPIGHRLYCAGSNQFGEYV